MFTTRALEQHIQSFLLSLKEARYPVSSCMLYGSYAHGRPTAHSDIDLAIWFGSPQFFDHYTDVPELRKIVLYHHPISPKFYNEGDDDPFIDLIERTGRAIPVPKS